MGFFDFLGKSAEDYAKGVGSVFSFLGKSAGEYAQGVGSVFQGAARVPEQTARTVAQPLVDVVNPGATASQQGENTGLREVLYGKSPVQTYYDIARSGGQAVAQATGNKDLAKYGILAAPIIAGLDLTTGGKGAGVSRTVEQLAKDTTEAAVRKTLGNTVAPEIANRLAPVIAQTSDKNVIRNLLSKTTPEVQQASHITTEANLPSIINGKQLTANAPPLPGYEGQNAVYLQAGKTNPYGFAGENNAKIVFNRDNLPPHVVNGDELAVQGNLPVTPKNVDHVEVGNPNLVPALEKRGFIVKYDPKLNVQQLADASIPNRPLSGAALQSSMAAKNIDNIPLSELGGNRPENALQTTFETAINKGDVKGAQAAVDMVKAPELKTSLQSVLDRTKSPDIVSATVPKAPPQTSAQTVIDSLKGLQGLRNQQEKLYTAERGKRFAAAQGAGEGLQGTAGFKAETKQLKGKFQKVEWKGLTDKVGPDQAEKLYGDLRAQAKAAPNLTYTDKLNTDIALRKLVLGEGLPTNSELKRLRDVFGNEFADAAEQGTSSFRQKAKTLATELLGAPRAILSSGDFSGGLRQALAYGTRHPIEFAKQWVKQFKYFGQGLKNQDTAFKASLKEIQAHPDFPILQNSKLAVVDTTGANISKREEQFVGSGLVERIPGLGRIVKGSNQAYAGLLNNIRANEFYRQLDRARAGGVPITDKLTKDLATVINTMTGRGSLGKLDKHMGALSSVLFAPRLMASRIQTLNPLYYAKLDPFARKEAVTGLLSLGAFVGGVLGLAKLSGLEVGTEPTSADFGKIKVGDTRFDVAGGFQQYVKLAAQLAEGKITSSTSGNEIQLGQGLAPSRLDVVYHFLEGKENPVVSFLTTIAKGKDINGNPTNTPEGIANQAAQRMIPLFAQDLTDVLNHPNAANPLVTAPLSLFGVGTQTYGKQDLPLSDKQKATVKQLQDKGAPQDYIDATTSFYQNQKAAPDRAKVSGDINQALASGDHAKAIQLAKDYNSKYASSFKDWLSKYDKYASDKTLTKEYASGRIKLTASSIQQRLKNIKTNPLYAGE